MTQPPGSDPSPWVLEPPPTAAAPPAHPPGPAGPPPSYPPPSYPPSYPPQSGWPSYGGPQWPSPPRPRRRWLPWLVAGLVLLFGGCAALVGTVGVHAVRQNNAARSAVDTFLTAVEHGDTATAQGLLCDQAQPDALQITLDSGIVQHRIVSVFVRRTSAFGSGGSTRESADVTVDVTLSTGIRHRDIVALEHQHGSWLLCGVTRSP